MRCFAELFFFYLLVQQMKYVTTERRGCTRKLTFFILAVIYDWNTQLPQRVGCPLKSRCSVLSLAHSTGARGPLILLQRIQYWSVASVTQIQTMALNMYETTAINHTYLIIHFFFFFFKLRSPHRSQCRGTRGVCLYGGYVAVGGELGFSDL